MVCYTPSFIAFDGCGKAYLKPSASCMSFLVEDSLKLFLGHLSFGVACMTMVDRYR